MKPEVLGFIPARGGSKGVPGKNIRILAGKPLICWTIEAALHSNLVNEVVVSTDDPDIAMISSACGVKVINRPADISGDVSPVIDALRHTLSVREAAGSPAPNCIVLLQPTAPQRLASDIDAAITLFFSKKCTPVCSVVRCEDNHPARMYRLATSGLLVPIYPELSAVRRQDLPPVFHRNGAVYVFGPREAESGIIIGDNMLSYEMPASRSFNIDTELDLKILQAVMAAI